MKECQRNNSIEFLRIVAIVLIIAYHFCYTINYTEPISDNNILSIVVGSWGICGTDIFFIITAFFLIEKEKPFQARKVFGVIFTSILYGGLSVLIFYWLTGIFPTKYELLTSFGAPFFEVYWFITVYIVLNCLSPFLNAIIRLIETEMLRRLLIVVFVLCFGIKVLNYNASFSGLGVAIFIYFLVGYLKQKDNNFFCKYRKVGFIITSLSVVIIQILIKSITGTGEFTYIFTGRYAVLQLFLALFVFYFFKEDIVFPSASIISFLSRGTIGVYCLHENPLLRPVLVNDIFCITSSCTSSNFCLNLLFSIFITLLVCALFDAIRRMILSRPLALLSKTSFVLRLDEWFNIK